MWNVRVRTDNDLRARLLCESDKCFHLFECVNMNLSSVFITRLTLEHSERWRNKHAAVNDQLEQRCGLRTSQVDGAPNLVATFTRALLSASIAWRYFSASRKGSSAVPNDVACSIPSMPEAIASRASTISRWPMTGTPLACAVSIATLIRANGKRK